MVLEIIVSSKTTAENQNLANEDDISYIFQPNPLSESNPPLDVPKLTPVEDLENIQNQNNNSKPLRKEVVNAHVENPLKLLILNLIYILIILAVSILWSTPATLIPAHNAIRFPIYWWETLITGSTTIAMWLAVLTIIDWKILYGMTYSKLLLPFTWLFVNAWVSLAVSWCVCYLMWTQWLGYKNPMPFVGMICYVVSNFSHFIGIWFLFPKQHRPGVDDRKKDLAYIGYRLWQIFYVQQQLALKVVMIRLPSGIQWIVAIILPILRELNLIVLQRILKNATDSDKGFLIRANITASVSTNINNSFWMAIIISSLATDVTNYSLLAIDFILNVFGTWKIIKLSRMILTDDDVGYNEHQQRKKEDIMGLIAAETIEMVVPIAYVITFALAFYGENADIIGGVKFSGWQHEEVDDFLSFSTDLILMLAIDIVCLIVSGNLLWKFASINILSEGYIFLKQYGMMISVRMGGTIFLVTHLCIYFKNC